MSQKSLPLTVEGFLERLKQEGFTCPQIHASIAIRTYLLGDYVLWCSPQGYAYLIEFAEYKSATKQRRNATWVAADMLFYEDAVERMLAEIRKRVTKEPEVKEEPTLVAERKLTDWEKAWGYKPVVLRGDT